MGLLVAVTAGCGGTEGNGRAKKSIDATEAIDIGSQPVLCSVTNDYEFSMLQDFERDSVSGGWYFNNDQCDKCQKIIDRIKELNKLLNIDRSRELPTPTSLAWSLTGTAFPDKWGCNDWTMVDPSTTAAAKAAHDAELSTLYQKLSVGDPDNNVPADCQTVCRASQFPDPYIKPLEASRIEFSRDGTVSYDQPRCGSRFAMHVKGGPFQTWGGSFAIQLGHPGLDASGWDGISFWARVGPESRNPLRIELSDKHTDDKQIIYRYPGASRTSYVTQDDLLVKASDEATGTVTVVGSYFDAVGPDGKVEPTTWCANKTFACNGDSTRDDRNGCDKFGANRSMTGDWQFYTIDFSSVRQSGWGLAAKDEDGNPVGLDTSDIRSLNFMWTTGIWDVWIDDVALYRRKP